MIILYLSCHMRLNSASTLSFSFRVSFGEKIWFLIWAEISPLTTIQREILFNEKVSNNLPGQEGEKSESVFSLIFRWSFIFMHENVVCFAFLWLFQIHCRLFFSPAFVCLLSVFTILLTLKTEREQFNKKYEHVSLWKSYVMIFLRFSLFSNFLFIAFTSSHQKKYLRF